MTLRRLTGRCLCGAVTLTAETAARSAHECHCMHCRRQSGHVWAWVRMPRRAVRFDGPVRRYAHSADAVRGFCAGCGSTLFWEPNATGEIDVSAGILDAPTGLTLGAPAYADSKGDYY